MQWHGHRAQLITVDEWTFLFDTEDSIDVVDDGKLPHADQTKGPNDAPH
jgi:hypothetical protein